MAEPLNPRIHPNANGGPPLIDGVTIKDIRKMQAMRRVWLDCQNVKTPTELIAALHQIMFSDDNYESFQGTPTIARLCRVKKADTIQKALQTLEKRDLTVSQSRGVGRSKLRRFQPQNLVEAEITKYVENLPKKRVTRSKDIPTQRVPMATNLPTEGVTEDKNLPAQRVTNLPNEQVGSVDSGQHLPVQSSKPTRSTGVISDSKRKKDKKTTSVRAREPDNFWQQHLNPPTAIEQDYVRNPDGTLAVLNGARAEWVGRFGGDEEAFDLALIQAANYVQPNNVKSIAVQIRSQLANIVARKRDQDKRYEAAASRKQPSKTEQRKADSQSWLARNMPPGGA